MKNFAFLLLAALAAGCSQPDSQATATTAAAPVPVVAAAPEAPVAPTAAVNTPRAKALLAQPATVVLDVRTPVEYLTGHLGQASNLNVSADDFAQRVGKLDTTKTYVLYCRSGKRSSKAADIMYQKGFHHVVNGGGYTDLKE